MGAFANANPAGRASPQAPEGLDHTATIRCADFDLWLLLLGEVRDFIGTDPINALPMEKMNYVLRDMGLARRGR
jgi:hypothetical protein